MKLRQHFQEDQARFVILLVLCVLFISSMVAFSIPSIKCRITGSVLANAYIRSASNVYCNTTLYAGWNLVSFPCFSNSEVLGSKLSSIAMRGIFSYDLSDGNNPWKSFSPQVDNNYTQDLTTISRLKGYYILVVSDQAYSASNYLSYPYSIGMVQGWNLVGYPNTTVKAMNESTSSVFGSYNIIRGMNNSNKTQLYFIYGDENSTLNFTYPFTGHWLNMSQADTWVVE